MGLGWGGGGVLCGVGGGLVFFALPLGQDLVCDVVTEKHLQVDEEVYKLSNWGLYISSR